ncbi:hypothetical protein LF1_40700 [Rubripirellula obstinata]|uniref:Chromosome partition protein Smc n=1 Tax=Rubripirellula obstinata TaxID=406547 RepID=A0A5B1CPH9_9BACT|nr:hypothetical protein [Rubripirellula obstinata]KAA1261520.1 hypothetical protein LF1_40700 [Rubripirellula obstinata]
MPISGPVVHQQLMDAYNQVQADLKVQRDRLTSSADGRDELFDQRGNALVKLAEHYLPELTPDAVRKTWTEVQPSFHELLRRKESAAQSVAEQLQSLIAEKEQQDQALLSVDAELDAASDQQDEVAAQVESSLQADDDFAKLSDRAAVAEAALERAEANLQEIDQDSARKLPAYEESTLFRYLRDQGFGTPDYKKRGFTRRMDRWVAKMVDYNKAKQGYEFLKETPQRMRQIIAEDREALDLVMTELERRRDVVAEQLGLPDRIEQVNALIGQRNEVLGKIDTLLDQCNQKQIELTEIEDPRGTHYKEAIGMFRDMLSRVDQRDLERQARLTAEISDDQIVADLIDVDAEIESLDDANRRRQKDVSQQQVFLEDLGRLVQRFRAAGFDSGRSQFVGTLDIIEELNRARNVGDAELLWERIRSNQRWGPTAMEKITAVATHPMTQVLVNAMAHAAGGAMRDHARRAGRRRSAGYGGGRGPWGGPRSTGRSSPWGGRR